jgi:hypothetical protein
MNLNMDISSRQEWLISGELQLFIEESITTNTVVESVA